MVQMEEERPKSPAVEFAFPRTNASPLLSEGRPGTPAAQKVESFSSSMLESPRWEAAIASGEDMTCSNPALLLASAGTEVIPKRTALEIVDPANRATPLKEVKRPSAGGPRAPLLTNFTPEVDASLYEEEDYEEPPRRSKSKSKSRRKASADHGSTGSLSLPSANGAEARASSGGNGGSAGSKRRSHSGGSGLKGHKELSIEERLDLQLQQIMKTKSKLAIAMERVSADMHIKKRDREIVKLRKDVAEYTHTIHKQKEALISKDEAAKDLQTDYKNLQKRNFKLLQKQRHYDDMKRQLEAGQPEESTEDLTARIKKEVMAKMERTLYEMKHARAELAREVKHEQAANHKANTVISELEIQLKEIKEEAEALRDQVRYVMTSEQEKTTQIEILEKQADSLERERSHLQERCDKQAAELSQITCSFEDAEANAAEFKERSELLQSTVEEMKTSLADLTERTADSEGAMYDQSKKHAIAAERVVTLQQEVRVLEKQLKARDEEAAEEAAIARDVVVNEQKKQLEAMTKEKNELEVALGKLVGETEAFKLKNAEKIESNELAMEKALKKVEKLPILQQKLHEESKLREETAERLADVTAQLRVLEAGKERAAKAEIASEAAKVELEEAAKAAERAADTKTALEDQLESVQSEKAGALQQLAAAEAAQKAAEDRAAELEAEARVQNAAQEKLAQQVDAISTEKELVQSELAGCKVTMEDVKGKLKLEREKTLSLQQEATRAGTPSSGPNDTEVLALQAKVQQLEAQLEAMRGAKGQSSWAEPREDAEVFTLMRQEKWDHVNALMAQVGFDPCVKDRAGFTPLMVAAQHGAREVIMKLAELGADVNAQNQHGATALHLCSGDHKDLAAVLVECGADQTIPDNSGNMWNEV